MSHRENSRSSIDALQISLKYGHLGSGEFGLQLLLNDPHATIRLRHEMSHKRHADSFGAKLNNGIVIATTVTSTAMARSKHSWSARKADTGLETMGHSCRNRVLSEQWEFRIGLRWKFSVLLNRICKG